MIPESIPSEAADVAVILVRVAPSVGEDQIGIDPFSKGCKPGFDDVALFGEKTVPERHNFDLRPFRRG